MENVELAVKDNVRNEKVDGDFSVDDLLDFSNDDVFAEDDEKRVSVSVNDGNDDTLRRSNDSSVAGEDFKPLPTSELAVPMDDLAELEWLSNFVEDSFTPPCTAPAKKPVWLTGNRRHPVPPPQPVNEESSFKTPLPVKIRSKRARTGATVWSLGSPSSSSSTTSSSSSSGPSSPLWLSSGVELFDEPVVRKQNKTKKRAFHGGGQAQTQTRRCSHCGVQKTPQWRAGPNGAKTLCNACGVRFKSGRLLPEYRPACSPTFSSELHSNHHRKVIEMRRKKETSDADKTGLNPPVQAVPSF